MRSRTIRVALVVAAAVFVPACAADHFMAPKRAVTIDKRAGMTFRPMNGASLDEVETESSASAPCTSDSWACTRASLTQGVTSWVFSVDSYLVAQQGTAQFISTAGYGKVSRGYYNPISSTTVLSCMRTGGRTCPDVSSLDQTCNATVNSATLTSQHVIQLAGYYPSLSSMNAHGNCDGPTPDLCDGGSGGDSITSYAQSIGVVRGGKAHLDCSNIGGGGTDLVCEDEWIELDISYDGGMTWSPLWEGWGDVCDIAAEE